MANRKPHRTVFITGASGGIGRALALCYAEPGRLLILHGRNPQRLAAVAQACAARGAHVQTERYDLRARDGRMEWIEGLAARFPIDLAIINAGVATCIGPGQAGEPWQEAEDVLEVNLVAAIALATGLLPSMRRRGGGQIALISSLAAYHGLPLTPSYCASKAGLKAYGEALRGGLAAEGIAVNVVLPGFVTSEMSAAFSGPKPFLMAADTAAAIIRRGLEKNTPRISFPFPLSLGCWLLAVLPPTLSQWLLGRLRYGA
jgi:short-subunit dehydrogenase